MHYFLLFSFQDTSCSRREHAGFRCHAPHFLPLRSTAFILRALASYARLLHIALSFFHVLTPRFLISNSSLCLTRFCLQLQAGGGHKSRVTLRFHGLYVPFKRFVSLSICSRQASLALVGTSGLEPPTSRLSGVRSNHLSYAPMLDPSAFVSPIPSPLQFP